MTDDRSPMESTTRSPALPGKTEASPTDRPPPSRRLRLSDAPPKAVPELPAEGDLVEGKYRVEERIGIGGMGVVVAARHVQLKQRVALKFLLPEGLRKKGLKERFLREARAAVAISSEHIARVLDVGALPNGVPFIVMEYLEGTDLSQLLDDRGTFSVEEAAVYVLEACEAVAAAHSLGIVHRDLKPSNLFLAKRPDGTSMVKVLDFGIAKSTDDDAFSAELTQTNQSMGSPQYMSPEQVRDSKNVDARTDIWALGVVLYELVAGRAPFVAESLPALSAQIVADPVPPLEDHCPGVAPAFAELVHRCLEKDAKRRFANLAELARALEPFAKGHAPRADRISLVVDRRSTRAPSSSDRRAAKAASTRTPVAVDATTVHGSAQSDKGGPIPGGTLGAGAVESSTELAPHAPRRNLLPAALGILLLVAVGVFFGARSLNSDASGVTGATASASTTPAVAGSSTSAGSMGGASSSVASRASGATPAAAPSLSAALEVETPPPADPLVSARPSAKAPPTTRPPQVAAPPVKTAEPKASSAPPPDPYGDRK